MVFLWFSNDFPIFLGFSYGFPSAKMGADIQPPGPLHLNVQFEGATFGRHQFEATIGKKAGSPRWKSTKNWLVV